MWTEKQQSPSTESEVSGVLSAPVAGIKRPRAGLVRARSAFKPPRVEATPAAIAEQLHSAAARPRELAVAAPPPPPTASIGRQAAPASSPASAELPAMYGGSILPCAADIELVHAAEQASAQAADVAAVGAGSSAAFSFANLLSGKQQPAQSTAPDSAPSRPRPEPVKAADTPAPVASSAWVAKPAAPVARGATDTCTASATITLHKEVPLSCVTVFWPPAALLAGRTTSRASQHGTCSVLPGAVGQSSAVLSRLLNKLPLAEAGSVWAPAASVDWKAVLPASILPGHSRAAAYLASNLASALQQLNYAIAAVAAQYWPAYSAVASACGMPDAHGKLSMQGGTLSAKQFPADQCAVLQRRARAARVAFYGQVELLRFANKKQAEGGETHRYYLSIQRKDAEKSSAYRPDDFWLVSTSPQFTAGSAAPRVPSLPPSAQHRVNKFAPANRAERCAGMCFVAKAAWNGLSSSNQMELLPVLPGEAHSLPSLGAGYMAAPVCAIRVMEGMTVADALDCLSHSLAHVATGAPLPDSMPALSPLLQQLYQPAAAARPSGSAMGLAALGNALRVPQVPLNPDQAQVVVRMGQLATSSYGSPGQAPVAPVQLVSGCFGGGKSHTLAAAIQQAAKLLMPGGAGPALPDCWPPARDTAPPRILLACATNAAVDRVLSVLLERGFHDLARVGSATGIAQNLRPHTLMSKSESTTSSFAGPQDGVEQDTIMQARTPAVQLRLRHAMVIGTTIASMPSVTSAGLQGFSLVLHDEASQLPEWASLIPILRVAPAGIVAVGDPKQLPPPIASSPVQARRGESAPGIITLFDRAAANLFAPLPLRVQYRCHPNIAALASAVFYDGQVQSGVPAHKRGPIVRGLPPVSVYDMDGAGCTSTGTAAGSHTNDGEAAVVCRLICELLGRGVAAKDVGVIVMYRSQVWTVRRMLGAVAECAAAWGARADAPAVPPAVLSAVQACACANDVTVSTVDGFQGDEREVMLLSTVKSSPSSHYEGKDAHPAFAFLDDSRRLNVAITRARRHVMVIGGLSGLSGATQNWKRLLALAGLGQPGTKPVQAAAACVKIPGGIPGSIGGSAMGILGMAVQAVNQASVMRGAGMNDARVAAVQPTDSWFVPFRCTVQQPRVTVAKSEVVQANAADAAAAAAASGGGGGGVELAHAATPLVAAMPMDTSGVSDDVMAMFD